MLLLDGSLCNVSSWGQELLGDLVRRSVFGLKKEHWVMQLLSYGTYSTVFSAKYF
jgi:hypothetical protein